MATNRKQPFGYRMEMGRIVIEPTEAEAVKYIFREYNLGASFLELARIMQEQGIPYDGDKPWNKNMIARILADARYIGADGLEQIIPQGVFTTAQEKRSKKSAPIRQTEAQKLLRQKRGCKATPKTEQAVLNILNRIIRDPSLLQTPDAPWTGGKQATALETQVKSLLAQLPVDEDTATEKIYALAAARYEAVDPRGYETERLKRRFQMEQPKEELDAGLIKYAVSAVLTDSSGKVTVKLKNDQVMEG